jgi:hypothetical protein
MPVLSRLRILAAVAAFLILPVSFAAAQDHSEFQMSHDIRVDPGQETNDLSCINCSIRIQGNVKGDVFAMNGNVVLEQGAQVSGDISTIHGDVRLGQGSKVGGDIAAIAGTVRRDSQAAVGGDIASMAGAGWSLLVFIVPLMLLGGFIALIIWLIQRSRRPAAMPAQQPVLRG